MKHMVIKGQRQNCKKKNIYVQLYSIEIVPTFTISALYMHLYPQNTEFIYVNKKNTKEISKNRQKIWESSLERERIFLSIWKIFSCIHN